MRRDELIQSAPAAIPLDCSNRPIGSGGGCVKRRTLMSSSKLSKAERFASFAVGFEAVTPYSSSASVIASAFSHEVG